MPTFAMADVAALIERVRVLETGTASFMADKTIVHFTLDGEKGWLRLKADEGVEANGRRAIAAARTQLGGRRPRDLEEVKAVLGRHLGKRALIILLNPEAYTVVGAHWRDIAYGAQV